MINIDNKIDCCGCNACGDICPKGSISFETDIEGFWYPVVNHETCVDCGLCEKVCPIINVGTLKTNDLEKSECYIAENKNISVVFSSTSGGLFSVFADATYRKEGYVGGAIFNDDFSVKQILTDSRDDLAKLRGSKYIQSNLIGFYKEVKTHLLADQYVLVCGSPCQMAALRRYLHQSYDKLIIVDYICRGIGSPKVFHNYLKTFETRYGSPVVSARAKSKEYGWRNLTQKVVLKNGKCVFETAKESVWTTQFNRDGLFHRPSCHDCKFKGVPRISDITIADFWGAENLKLNGIEDKNLGLSIVMVNSQKGKLFFESVKKKINFQEVPFDSLLGGNRALFKNVQQETVDRASFYNDLNHMTLHDAISKYYPKEKDPIKFRLKTFVKKYAKLFIDIYKYTNFRITPLWQFFKYNSFKQVKNGNVLIPTPYCIIENHGEIRIKGMVILGRKRIKKSRKETRLLVDKGGVFETNGPVTIGYGSDIEVFSNACLTFEGNSNINSDAIIICAERIILGKESRIGRGVTIRDNNGKHYIDIPGYKTSRPIVTEDHVWYGEGVTIMQGVKIGQGAVISAKSVVTSNVPAHSIVSGNPVQVVQNDIRWKF